MVKIFYYDDETENLLEESDAGATDLDEAIDELFNLADDDVSYIGFITESEQIKVKSDQYDHYKVYLFDVDKQDYILSTFLNFDQLKVFVVDKFKTAGQTTNVVSEAPIEKGGWLPLDWNKN